MKFSIAEAEDLVSSIFERNGVLPQNARSVAKALVASEAAGQVVMVFAVYPFTSVRRV